MNRMRSAKYKIGEVVRHRIYPFRGVVFDIDPVFDNTEEWYQSIPAEVRCRALVQCALGRRPTVKSVPGPR